MYEKEHMFFRDLAHKCAFSPDILLGGRRPLQQERKLLFRSFVLWFLLIMDQLQRTDASFSVARFERLCESLVSCDLFDVIRRLDGLYLFCVQCYRNPFKEGLSMQPSWESTKSFLSPILPVLSRLFSGDDNDISLGLSIFGQFSRFLKKLHFEDANLQSSALDSYCETEDRITNLSLPRDLVDQLEKRVYSRFHAWEPNIVPWHGTGSVAEGPLTTHQKYDALRTDCLLTYTFGGMKDHMSFFPTVVSPTLRRISKTIFVPKNLDKLRTISMEPCTLQYFQQGVMRELYRYIEYTAFRGNVILSDQRQNQLMAKDGSEFGHLSTLDLSAASDSVSWQLVKSLFRRVPLLRYLISTRSRATILPNGEQRILAKFAPMGSALCFPIECIVFAVVCEEAVEQCSTDHSLWSVYGDDIVLPTAAYDTCVDMLSQLGFHVNTEKSYSIGPYRESCGKEYWLGRDITPLYLRNNVVQSEITPSRFSSSCALANACATRAYHYVRRYIISNVLSWANPGPIFCSDADHSPRLQSPNPTNFHLKERWNYDLCRFEVRGLVSSTKPKDGRVDNDLYRYYRRLCEMARRVRVPLYPPSEETLHAQVETFCSTWVQSVER